MTTAYSQTDSEALAYIKQVAILAVINKIVTWEEVDEFEIDVLQNLEGLEGLKHSSHEFIEKVKNFNEHFVGRAC